MADLGPDAMSSAVPIIADVEKNAGDVRIGIKPAIERTRHVRRLDYPFAACRPWSTGLRVP
jgi:hypothetical protein